MQQLDLNNSGVEVKTVIILTFSEASGGPFAPSTKSSRSGLFLQKGEFK